MEEVKKWTKVRNNWKWEKASHWTHPRERNPHWRPDPHKDDLSLDRRVNRNWSSPSKRQIAVQVGPELELAIAKISAQRTAYI